MNEKQLKKLSNKCTKARDKLIDKKFKDDVALKKYIKKLFTQDELEELTAQFIMKEAVTTLLEDYEEKQSEEKEEENTNIMFT